MLHMSRWYIIYSPDATDSCLIRAVWPTRLMAVRIMVSLVSHPSGLLRAIVVAYFKPCSVRVSYVT
jgi:hypothetical protein